MLILSCSQVTLSFCAFGLGLVLILVKVSQARSSPVSPVPPQACFLSLTSHDLISISRQWPPNVVIRRWVHFLKWLPLGNDVIGSQTQNQLPELSVLPCFALVPKLTVIFSRYEGGIDWPCTLCQMCGNPVTTIESGWQLLGNTLWMNGWSLISELLPFRKKFPVLRKLTVEQDMVHRWGDSLSRLLHPFQPRILILKTLGNVWAS